MKKLIASLGILMALGIALWVSAQSSSFKVVVHPDNPATSMSAKDVSRYLLKKVTRWNEGGFSEAVSPIDLDSKSPIREAFSKEVHGRSAASIESFWNRQIFSGENVPPPEAASDADVVAHVRSTRGAIGYVSADANASGVKVVALAP
jgi:ABC-type phosphate transport system substrate-binding protein